MSLPEPEQQVQFLFKIQRLLSEGVFVSSYKFALLLALADLAVERGDDTTEALKLDTRDVAEKFIAMYWRQVLPWATAAGPLARLHQATGGEAAILRQIASAHQRSQGSLVRLQHDRPTWEALMREVSSTIAVMPLWKLQTVGGQRLEFLYPNVGRGRRFSLRGDAVYCFRRFRGIVGDLAEAAWIRFVRSLPRNRGLLGESADLREFLFGADRTLLVRFRRVLLEAQDGRCFYCGGRFSSDPAVDHFIPWSRYPLDLGHNLVLADARCNSDKADRLAAFGHLDRWCTRNEDQEIATAFTDHSLPQDLFLTRRVASWAYDQAERVQAGVWERKRDDLVDLDRRWRSLPGISRVNE